ncbi:phospholipase D-like protein [Promicromonospora sp. AC04]|nr:phospholipase D-like protein [Promicromonospora sp. AC04]
MVDLERRPRALELVSVAGLRLDRDLLVAVLRGVEGARSVTRRVETIWTMPGHLAGGGGLTTSLVRLVEGARESVVCSTFNFQRSSGMWGALQAASRRSGVGVRVYVDAGASADASGPSAGELAEWLAPGEVFRTRDFDGKPVRNHAKFLSVDHRFVVVTSANFSWSAENGNVELGVRIDDPGLADRVEREMRDAEDVLYEVVER